MTLAPRAALTLLHERAAEAVRGRDGGEGPARLGVDVKVIITPLCTFYSENY